MQNFLNNTINYLKKKYSTDMKKEKSKIKIPPSPLQGEKDVQKNSTEFLRILSRRF